MAVTPKTVFTLDMNSGTEPHKRYVHYIKLGKGNRKGTAQAIGGELVDHLGHSTGDFHIELNTLVNRKDRKLSLEAGDVVFRTNDSKRWQVMTLKGFRKRFPEAKI